MFGEDYLVFMTVLLKVFDRKKILGSIPSDKLIFDGSAIIAGFFTGGSLAIRGILVACYGD